MNTSLYEPSASVQASCLSKARLQVITSQQRKRNNADANFNNDKYKQRNPMESDQFQEAIDKAFAGDRVAVDKLVQYLTPIIQNKVARVLLSTLSSNGVDIRQEVQDVSQDVFSLIFSNNGKVLRSWQPEKGASLPYYIGIVAERRTLNHVRKLGRLASYHKDDCELDDNSASKMTEPENQAISSQLLERLMKKISPQLSAIGQQMFDLLFLQELPIADVCARADMKEDAVYAWRSRLRRKIKSSLEDIEYADGFLMSERRNRGDAYEQPVR